MKVTNDHSSKLKKAFPIGLMLLGIVFAAAGVYTVGRGLDAKDQVRDELAAQAITTPEDASMPNVAVTDAATAKSMADIIDVHVRKSTGGRTYAEMGRFLAKDGGDTNVAEEAVVGADGKPVANPLRNVAFQASALRTSLYTSVMAFNVGDLVIGLGAMILVLGLAFGGIGVALGGLVIPRIAKKAHLGPVLAKAA